MREIAAAAADEDVLEEIFVARDARTRLATIIERLFETTPQSSTSLRVMQAVDEPLLDARGLADLIMFDPFLEQRVLRLANTAYYGLQQPAQTLRVAVGVIGFAAIRSLAAMAAIGIDRSEVPPTFLSHSAQVAVGASLCAPVFDVSGGDAFSGGLLHDIGEALLFRADPALWVTGQVAADTAAFETAAFGMDHMAAGVLVLQAWQMPGPLLDAVGWHHAPAATIPPVARCVAASEAIVIGDSERARALGLDDDQIESFAATISDESSALQAWLQNG